MWAMVTMRGVFGVLTIIIVSYIWVGFAQDMSGVIMEDLAADSTQAEKVTEHETSSGVINTTINNEINTWTDNHTTDPLIPLEHIPVATYMPHPSSWETSTESVLAFDSDSSKESDVAKDWWDGGTNTEPSRCNQRPTVLQPYDIIFEPFCAEEVFESSITKPGVIEQGDSEYFKSEIEENNGLFLVVFDPCGTTTRHADIMFSPLIDTNQHNAHTANELPPKSVMINLKGQIYFLSGTHPTDDIISTNYYQHTLETPLQLIERTQANDWSWTWWFGVQPEYSLLIPQYQQLDSYQGTLTRTLIY